MSSAGRALRILEALLALDHPPTQAELLREVELPKSTLSALLAELGELGYLNLVERRYLPGPEMMRLGYGVTRRAGLGRTLPGDLHPVLERLAAATGETVTFSIEVGRTASTPGSVLALDHVVSPNPVRYVPGIGRPQPIHRAAAGRVLLAFSGRSAADIPRENLVPTRSSAVVEPEQVDEMLRVTRERGYALNVEETVEGVTAIAAPILGPDGEAAAAITVVGPSQRMPDPAATIWPVLRAEVERLGAAAASLADRPSAGLGTR